METFPLGSLKKKCGQNYRYSPASNKPKISKGKIILVGLCCARENALSSTGTVKNH